MTMAAKFEPHPDWSSEYDSEDDFGDDDYNFKKKIAENRTAPRELTEEEKRINDVRNFSDAVRYGDIEQIVPLIEKGFDVNLDLDDGWTAIMLAAAYGRPDIVRILIDSGANVNKARDATTPLMMACKNLEDHDKYFDVVKLLVEAGAEVQVINRKRMDALMHAACSGNILAVEYLLPLSNKNAVDNQGWSALTWAVSNNQSEVVKFLYDNDFDANLVDVRGNTPLTIAMDNGFEEIVNLFPQKEETEHFDLITTMEPFEEAFKGLKKGEKPAFFNDVCEILASVKCAHLIPLFKENNIKIGDFLAMDEAGLKKTGVLLPYQRHRILTGLHRFHKQPYHPQSIHVCVNNASYSNLDVAKTVMSSIKQVIAMEASLKYLLKHLEKKDLSKEELVMANQTIENIKIRIKCVKAVTRKLNERVKQWDSVASPADLITKKSIRSHFPWKKITFCLGVISVVLVCKYKPNYSRLLKI